MICPQCGNEIEDDKLYCGICGTEINFVPDFEPEIEQSITDTLSEIKLPDEVYDSDYEYYEEAGYDPDNPEYAEEVYYDDNQEEYSSEYADEEYLDEEYLDNEYSEEYLDEESDYSNEYDDGYSLESEYYDEEYLEDEYDDSEYYDDEYDDEYDDFDEEFSGDPFDDFEYESHIIRNVINHIKNSRFRWLYLVGLILLVIIIAVSAVKLTKNIKNNNSSKYQYEMALKSAADGDYQLAINYLEKALKIDPTDSSKKYLMADYYFKLGDNDNALLMLWEIINDNDVNSADAYRKIIKYYADLQDYKQIEEILANCNKTEILEEFNDYLANAPMFSVEEGTYDDIVVLTLSSNCNGRIYYTLDGSTPNYDSDVYTTPLTFDELGQHTVSAFFVNTYGTESEVVKKTYLIDIVNPNPPNVLLDAGTYEVPQLIEVDVQRYCTVYYTTDGSAPNLNSNEYTGPITMPIGKSHFIFIAYSQENIPGDITEVDYELNIATELDVTDITTKLWIYDALIGKTGDLQGHMPGTLTQYTYVVNSAITFDKDGELFYLEHDAEGEEEIPDPEKAKEIDPEDIEIYYIFTEQQIDTYGNVMKTGVFYLVSSEDGQIYKANKDDEGIIHKLEAMKPEEYTLPNAPISSNEANITP